MKRKEKSESIFFDTDPDIRDLQALVHNQEVRPLKVDNFFLQEP